MFSELEEKKIVKEEKIEKICKFLNSESGCKNGESCKFKHNLVEENKTKAEINNLDLIKITKKKKSKSKINSKISSQDNRDINLIGSDKLQKNQIQQKSPTIQNKLELNDKSNSEKVQDKLISEFNIHINKLSIGDHKKSGITTLQIQKHESFQNDKTKPLDTSTKDVPSTSLNPITSPQSIKDKSNHSLNPITSPHTIKERPIVIKPTIQKSITNPLEKAQFIRETELKQLSIRFPNSKINHSTSSTIINLELVPSDPDFPFELESLSIQLSIPNHYPYQNSALIVINPEIPHPICQSIKFEWEKHCSNTIESLLKNLNWLDRNLEDFFTFKQSQIELIRAVDISVDQSNVIFNDTFTNTNKISTNERLTNNSNQTINESLTNESLTSNETSALLTSNDFQYSNQMESIRRGIEIRCIDLLLENVSLMECVLFSCSVKCSKCKAAMDFSVIPSKPKTSVQPKKWQQCTKCNTPIGNSDFKK